MRLLLAGDLHIGRSSSGINKSSSNDLLRASSVWNRIVELALNENIDLVCLSGDVVDRENKLWEAIGPLETGIRRLGNAGIATVAVAGNHDFDVLARLHDMLPEHFHLIGRGGQWERYTDRERRLHIDGWSFPRETVTQDPLHTYNLPRDPSIPTLGLVHGDLDVASSPYAPLSTSRLFAAAPSAWLLGHIHKPQLIDQENRWVLYPGSPQALDFGEQGAHGVWILSVDHQIGRPEMRPISSVRYDYLDIDLSGIDDEAVVEQTIINTIRASVERANSPDLRHLSLRLNLHGRTSLAHRVDQLTRNLATDFDLRVHDVTVEINRVQVAVLPDIDLDSYSREQSAPGAVARLLLALNDPEPPAEVQDLIHRTRHELENIDNHNYYASLERREINEESARAYLRDQAHALMTELVQQTA